MLIEYSARMGKVGDETHIVVEAVVNITPAILPVRNYQELLSLDQELSHKREQTILLRKTTIEE